MRLGALAICLACAGGVLADECSQPCATEFDNCVDFQGVATCNSELAAGTGPLMSVCTAGCTMPAPGTCSADCVAEFSLCVQYGPGEVGCAQELAAGTGPLGENCVRGCTLPASPPSPPLLPGGVTPCSSACRAEFNNCIRFGPGLAVCESELSAFTGPLAVFCEQGCQIPPEECSSACLAAYTSCSTSPGRCDLTACSAGCTSPARFSLCAPLPPPSPSPTPPPAPPPPPLPPPPPAHSHAPHSHAPHSHAPHSHTPHSHAPHSHAPHSHAPCYEAGTAICHPGIKNPSYAGTCRNSCTSSAASTCCSGSAYDSIHDPGTHGHGGMVYSCAARWCS